MANKNTKSIRLAVRQAGKSGNNEITFQVPVRDWHNHPRSAFRPITVTTARPNGEGVISTSGDVRNMQMRVLRNNNGTTGGSITVHEPIYKSRHVIHPNHEYMAKDKRFGGYFQGAK